MTCRLLAALAVLALGLTLAPAGASAAPGQDPDPDPTLDIHGPRIEVTRPANTDGWHPDTVTIGIRIVDVGTNGGSPSGFRMAEFRAYMNDVLVDSGPLLAEDTLTFSTEGSTRVEIDAWDRRENAGGAVHWVGVDRTAPWVDFTAPLAEGAQFALNQQVTGGFSCGDAHSGVASCDATITNGASLYTARPGTYTVRATATDTVGRVTERTVTYRVLPEGFTVVDQPSIMGTPRAGHLLTARPATFAPDPTTVSHQWFRGNVPIPGADRPTYLLTAADRNYAVRYVATARRENHADREAAAEPVKVDGLLDVVGTPSVRGTAAVGGLLTAVAPSIQVPPESSAPAVGLQWLRDGRAIPGATGATLRVGAADIGRRLAVRVAGSAAGYEPYVATSAATALVPRVTPTLTTKATPLGRRAIRLRVNLQAAGLPASSWAGRLVVKRGTKVVGRGSLVRGKAVLKLRKQPRGRVRLSVAYAGSAQVAARTAKVRVRVR